MKERVTLWITLLPTSFIVKYPKLEVLGPSFVHTVDEVRSH